MDELVYRIWALMVFGAGNRVLNELDGYSPKELYEALQEGSDEKLMHTARTARKYLDTPLSKAEAVLEECAAKHIGIVTVDDDTYPERLRNIYAPPVVLFYKGDLRGMDEHPAMGVVGTRKPSEYSRYVASALVAGLVRSGFSIVSGMAEGIDICASLAAVHNGGRVYEVLGCGVDYDYPKNNIRYREKLIEHGAIISEFLPGTQPLPSNFPQRNRILAGLSDGIAVIEAGSRSGSLNTSTHALNQGKNVYVIPPADLFDKRYNGNAMLLREGAIPLMGMRDLLDSENGSVNEESTAAPSAGGNTGAETEAAKEAAAETAVFENESAQREVPDAGSEAGNAILAAIYKGSGIHMDEIAETTGLDIDTVLETMTELEVMGYAENRGGLCYPANK